MLFSRGMRDKLSKYVNLQNKIEIEMKISGPSTYDYCCFGVDANEKLSDDRYMVFYNQVSTPNNEIQYIPDLNNGRFIINFAKLPDFIQKLVFTISIDGNGTMGEISNHSLIIKQENQSAIELNVNGSDFKNEKAIISVEIYRKQEWRIKAVMNGFNGGLSALLKLFGGEEEFSSDVKDVQTVEKAFPDVKNNQIVRKKETIIKPEKVSLKKGQKVRLEKISKFPIIIENGWTAKGKDYDLKALVRYRDGKLIYIGAANIDECLSTPEGAVRHGGDVRNPGELEYIEIIWHPDIASVAVSSYSAIENGTGSFQKYGVFVRIKNGSQVIEIPAKNTSVNSRSYTLCFGEIIYRDTPDLFEVSALELYSRPNSEYRIGYRDGKVMMDIGPIGQIK